MIVYESTRHDTLPAACLDHYRVIIRQSKVSGGCFISNGFPEQGAGANADTDCDSAETGGESPAVAASDDDDGGDDDGEPARREAPNTKAGKAAADKPTSLTNKRRDGAVKKMTTSQIAETRTDTNKADGALSDSLTFSPALFAFTYLSHYTSFGRSRIYQLIADPVLKFPQPIKIGKSSRWLKTEVDNWLTKQADSRHQVAG
nr:AlpA family phage regulatory protein [uncultured Albidiferax sp.]